AVPGRIRVRFGGWVIGAAAADVVAENNADRLGVRDGRVARRIQVHEEVLVQLPPAVAAGPDGGGLGRLAGREREGARLADEVPVAGPGGPVRGGVPDAHLSRTGLGQADGEDERRPAGMALGEGDVTNREGGAGAGQAALVERLELRAERKTVHGR